MGGVGSEAVEEGWFCDEVRKEAQWKRGPKEAKKSREQGVKYPADGILTNVTDTYLPSLRSSIYYS
jgi:hypothetical protein